MTRLYSVEQGEPAVDISNIHQISNIVAKFQIKPDYHHINDQWNGVHQADLEGYILTEENDHLMVYKIIGFEEDSKVFLDHKEPLIEDSRLVGALENYCNAYNPLTNEPLSASTVSQLIHQDR